MHSWPPQRPSARTKVLCVDGSLGSSGFQLNALIFSRNDL